MYLYYDEDEYETSFQGDGKTFFGMSRRKRSPEEILAIKAKREREREDKILAEADIIRKRRAAMRRATS